MPHPITVSRWLPFACACLLGACGDSSVSRSPADGGPDQAPDKAAPVGGDTQPDFVAGALPDTAPDLSPSPADTRDLPLDVAETSDAATCSKALSGAAPFGKQLSGTASFAGLGTAAAISSTIVAYIYFPAGRVAGAPVQLAVESRVTRTLYFFGPQATLADDLSAKGLTVGGHDLQITGDLLPGAGGLQASAAANFASPSTDVADDRTATMLMCPTGEVPTPELRLATAPLSPLATLGLNATTPISEDAMASLRITSPLGPVTFSVSAEQNSRYSAGPNFSIAASSAFPPSQPLTFDPSAVKDVLGRDVPITVGGTQVLTTASALTDLTFAAAPPAGAIACTGCSVSTALPADGGASAMSACTGGGTVSGGALKVVPGVMGSSRSVDALLALPATSATKLRVRMAVGDVNDGGTTCTNSGRYAFMRTAIVAAVGPNGEASTPLSLTCNGTLADYTIDLPKVSPLWLVVHLEGVTPMPYMLPPGDPPSLTIDELQFM